MDFNHKIFVTFIFLVLSTGLTGCPTGDKPDDPPEESYPMGTWGGSVSTEARLILRDEPQYWCAAWKIEALEIRLTEYQDGTLDGTLTANLFHWSVNDVRLLEYDEIASGQWHKFTNFSLTLSGQIDEEGYVLNVVDLPMALEDPNGTAEPIQFWDFLFPSKIEGDWLSTDRNLMHGDSIIPQGEDYTETSMQSTFREFSVLYEWEIKRL